MLAVLRQRNFVLLWLGGLISNIGDWVLMIGLPIYVYILTGSALATSLMLITGFLPGILFSSVAGVFVDRWDRRRTLLISNLLMAVGLLPLLLVHSSATLWIIYGVQFFEGCCEQFINPAEGALLPSLVTKEELVSANALKSLAQSSSRLIGGALGGILLSIFGLSQVALLDAGSFLFVCLMLALIRVPAKARLERLESDAVPASSEPASPPAQPGGALRKLLGEWSEGLRYISQQRALTVLFIMFAIQGLGEGVFAVMLVIFVRLVLHGGSVDYGVLLSVQAIGSLLGGAFFGQIGKNWAPARILGPCLTLFGLIDLLIVNIPALIPGLPIIILLFILVGIPGAGSAIAFNALIQNLVADQMLGRVFGFLMLAMGAMGLIGMLIAGALGDRLGPVLLLNIQGGMYTLSGLLGLIVFWRLRPSRT